METSLKISFLLLLITLSTQSLADCTEDFSKGMYEFGFASKYFQKGVDSYNRAIAESRTSNPDYTKICDEVVKSVTGFDVAKDAFWDCAGSFNQASTSCTGDDADNSTANKKLCLDNQTVAANNYKVVKKSLTDVCIKATEELESLELLNIDSL